VSCVIPVKGDLTLILLTYSCYSRYSHKGTTTKMSSDECTSVLKLSTMWNFYEVREMAVERLSQMQLKPIEKLVLAHKYNIDDWLVPALNQLAQQESLEEEDAERIAQVTSWGYVLKLMKVREGLGEKQPTASTTANTTANNSQGCGYSSQNNVRCNSCSRYGTYVCGSNAAKNRSDHDFSATIRTVFKLES
jgi:hypothetical protein